jgi:hypothetical protein
VTWKAYRVVFKLKSPMHIGCGKVGNVQRTRPYVTGRSFWGALTMRLTRDKCEHKNKPVTDSKLYEEVGQQVHDRLAYTYFYPAIAKPQKNNSVRNLYYEIAFPWKNESQFRRRFLSSYTSTALVYPQQAADEGLLHEVEFLSPRTLDEGKQVYLIGYVFEKADCNLEWQHACKHLQMGGERGYGWGDLRCVEIEPKNDLFDGQATFDGSGDKPVIQAEKLLAHASSIDLTAMGEIEPLVGREWRSHNSTNRYAGQHVENFGDICWIPGSVVDRSQHFVIENFGIWRMQQ